MSQVHPLARTKPPTDAEPNTSRRATPNLRQTAAMLACFSTRVASMRRLSIGCGAACAWAVSVSVSSGSGSQSASRGSKRSDAAKSVMAQ